MSKPTKIETYAVLWLNSQGLDEATIAGEINLTAKQIKSILDKQNLNTAIKTKSESMGVSPSKNLMIRETANKKKHVAIMTKEASMVNDDEKKKTTEKKINKNIFKINDQ
jgi:hypothetical protein